MNKVIDTILAHKILAYTVCTIVLILVFISISALAALIAYLIGWLVGDGTANVIGLLTSSVLVIYLVFKLSLVTGVIQK